MAQMQGQQGEVFFGEPDAELPNWRDVPDDDPDGDDLDKPLSVSQRKTLDGKLGFDTEAVFRRAGLLDEEEKHEDKDKGAEKTLSNERLTNARTLK